MELAIMQEKIPGYKAAVYVACLWELYLLYQPAK
jgi:hypothetical protein